MIWAIVLAFFGLNTALVAYVVVRLTVPTHGPWLALVTFNVVLIATCFGVVYVAS